MEENKTVHNSADNVHVWLHLDAALKEKHNEAWQRSMLEQLSFVPRRKILLIIYNISNNNNTKMKNEKWNVKPKCAKQWMI